MALRKKYSDTDSEPDFGTGSSRRSNVQIPSRYWDEYVPSLSKEEVLYSEKRVMVKSSHDGERFVTTVAKLSRKDCKPISEKDLRKGSSLLADISGSQYPVEVIGLEENMQKARQPKKTLPTTTETNTIKPKTAKSKEKEEITRKRNILNAVREEQENHAPPAKKVKLNPPLSELSCFRSDSASKVEDMDYSGNLQVPFTKEDHDMLMAVNKRTQEIHAMLKKIIRKQSFDMRGATQHDSTGPGVKQELEVEDEFIVNGANIKSRDVYAYGLSLLDTLFSKEEMAMSLVYASKKSKKPALDQERVQNYLLALNAAMAAITTTKVCWPS